MSENNNSSSEHRKVLTPRRGILLASVAGLGAAVLLAGPGGYRALNARPGRRRRARLKPPRSIRPASPISSPR